MSTLTPTQARLLRALKADGKQGLRRMRGGYCAGFAPDDEVFTKRAVMAAERAGLAETSGVCGAALHLTRAGAAAIDGADMGRRGADRAGDSTPAITPTAY